MSTSDQNERDSFGNFTRYTKDFDDGPEGLTVTSVDEWVAAPAPEDRLRLVEEFEERDPNGLEPCAPGAKLDAGKPDAGLLLDFGRALLAVAEVSTHGAAKYSRGGWQHVEGGVDRYTAAMLRHLLCSGREELDRDSGLTHAQQAAWNALARLELMLRREA